MTSKSSTKRQPTITKSKSNRGKLKQYTHDEKRAYNPPIGLVTPDTDKEMPRAHYSYDPFFDPALQWSGKKEHEDVTIDTVSLHVHERIDPLTILEKVIKKRNIEETMLFYFDQPEDHLPLREAVNFYKHDQNWSNRIIACDSLLIMNSLLQRESMGGKVQMVYIDPPYGIKYNSNFQPFFNKREVRDGKDDDLSQEPEMIKAFRDTWELGIHSYLSYLRDRFLLVKEMLSESGSIFVQISDENIHLVRILLDEVFGRENFVSVITFVKTSGMFPKYLPSVSDYILWYANKKDRMKYRQLFVERAEEDQYDYVEAPNGSLIRLNKRQLTGKDPLPVGRRLMLGDLSSQGNPEKVEPFRFNGRDYYPTRGRQWSTTVDGLDQLSSLNRLYAKGDGLFYKRYITDFPVRRLSNIWVDTQMGGWAKEERRIYVVQTPLKVIERCILMTTDPGDLVFDPTCGSGTTSYCAEKWGRRWITCDTSRVSIAVARQRMVTSIFDYYELFRPAEGVKSGFIYKSIPHITLSSVAKNEPATPETLYDKPEIDETITRISGPFTAEAVPAPVVKTIDDSDTAMEKDVSMSSDDETYNQQEWRDELLNTGIMGRDGKRIEFSRVEILPGTKWIHAEAETKDAIPKRVIISFGSKYAPLEQRQVALAIEEAESLIPKPKMIIFASFQFDPEAAKDIDELKWSGLMILKVQMNADLLTEDLKKKRASNESFWLIGQPEIELRTLTDGTHVVEVKGFDYYNTKTGQIESGDKSRIAMWMLDTDYDGRSFYSQQMFFPMAGNSEGWNKLSVTLRNTVNLELIEKYSGTVSIPFARGGNKRAAVKIIDDRGIESLRILNI